MTSVVVMKKSVARGGIPEEVIFAHILPRLPLKALGNFILVNKTWYAFIKSSSFTRSHLIQSISLFENDCTSGYFVHLLFNKNNQKTCGQLFAEGPNGYNSISDVKVVNFLSDETNLVVVGSCKGLLCITPDHPSKYGQRIYLWNPTIQKFRTVVGSAISQVNWIVLGCWYSFSENDFKLVRILNVYKHCRIEVYSLRTGLWKEKKNVSVNWIILPKKGGVFIDGYVNWLAHSSNNILKQLIVSFDTENEVFKTFDLPIQKFTSVSIMDYKGSLAVYAIKYLGLGSSNRWSLWVQRKDDNASYWVKLCNVVTPQRFYRPVGISINRHILLLTVDFRVVTYDIEDKILKDTEIFRYLQGFSHCVRYTKSLLLLEDN